MKGGLTDKKCYRRYKILKGKDDYASLTELIERRFSSGQSFPDVFILDGGKGQLGIIKEIKKELGELQQTQFIALGK